MNKTFLLIVLLLSVFQVSGLPAMPDSLRQKIAFAKNDSALSVAYARARDYFADDNIDSNLYYNGLLKQLAIKNNQPLVAYWCDLKESFYTISDGKFREAYVNITGILNNINSLKPENRLWVFDGHYSIEKNVELLRFRSHYNLGIIASSVLNNDEAIREFTIARNYVKQIDSLSKYFISCRNSIPFQYLRKGLPAEGFRQLAAEVNYIPPGQRDFSYMVLGKCLAAMQKDSLAKVYLSQAISIDGGANTKGRAAITLTDIYLKEKKTDSAFKYCRVVFDALQVYHAALFELNSGLAYKNYSKCFSLIGNKDSALKYAELSSDILDSLDNLQKRNISAFQQFTFEETQKLQKLENEQRIWQAKMLVGILVAIVAAAIIIAWLQYKNRIGKQRANEVLKSTLQNLKNTQNQLIHSEKMASLGELTAGIAHEIQNPLNFVNNFSDLSKELIDEMNEELEKGDVEEAKFIAADIKGNLEKINHHGKRADSIVRGMLQHSRSSSGEKQDTDINKLADEYLRLSYHGLRSKDKDFNADIVTNFDDTIGKILIAPQEIGRVILNLVNNAFYAVHEKSKTLTGSPYKPCVTVTTKRNEGFVTIEVSDNGNGIPQKIKDKIFNPFFTTKPTGQGTGLGLSLSYDIVKAHGGEIRVDSVEGEGTIFSVSLPVAP